MKNQTKKIFSFIIALCMLLTAFPLSAVADDMQPVAEVEVLDASLDLKIGEKPVFTARSANPELYYIEHEEWDEDETLRFLASTDWYNNFAQSEDMLIDAVVEGRMYFYQIGIQAVDIDGNNTFACCFDENTKLKINGVTYDVPAEKIGLSTFWDTNYAITFYAVITVTADAENSEHNFTLWLPKENEDCHYRACEECGIVETRNHVWDMGDVVKEPVKCQEDGLREYHCIVCMATKSEVIPAHENTEVLEACGASCTQSGWKEGLRCRDCGKPLVMQEEIKPFGHSWNNGVVTKEPTCTESGTMLYTCTVGPCGETRTEDIPAKGHDFADNKEKCSACGAVNPDYVAPAKVTVPAVALSSVKSKKSKQITVSWKKNTKVNGYEIQYTTDKKFKKSVKKVTVKKNKTTSTTIKKLSGKKKYYVRIRAYKTVNGKKHYSAWSKAKTVTTKK